MASTVGPRLFTTKVKATGASMPMFFVGFKPHKVVLYNLANQYRAEWVDMLGDGYAIVVSDQGIQAVVASEGITPGNDSAGRPGFTLGTLANINDTANEDLVLECWG